MVQTWKTAHQGETECPKCGTRFKVTVTRFHVRTLIRWRASSRRQLTESPKARAAPTPPQRARPSTATPSHPGSTGPSRTPDQVRGRL